MTISKIFAPHFDREEDTVTLSLAAEIAMYFHVHVEVAGASPGSADGRQEEPRRSVRGGASSGDNGDGLRTVFELWRRQHRLELQAECTHRGLASTSWLSLKDRPGQRLAQRAQFADLVCLGIKPDETETGDTRDLRAMLFSSGRPVLLQPAGDNMRGTSIMGEPIVIGWNGCVEAVHAMTGALPLIQRSRRVEIISIGEESVNALDAYELAKYLAWSGVRALATGIAVEDWTGGDVVDAALDKGAKLLVMGCASQRQCDQPYPRQLADSGFNGCVTGCTKERSSCALPNRVPDRLSSLSTRERRSAEMALLARAAPRSGCSGQVRMMLYVDIFRLRPIFADRGDVCVSIYLRTTPVTQQTRGDRIELNIASPSSRLRTTFGHFVSPMPLTHNIEKALRPLLTGSDISLILADTSRWRRSTGR
jgi:hypothetical protein